MAKTQKSKPSTASGTTKPEVPGITALNEEPTATPAKTSNSQFASILVMLKATYLILVIGLTQHASQRALIPLYGTATVSQHFERLFVVAMCLSLVLPTTTQLEGTLWNVLTGVLCLAPYSAYNIGSWTARWHNGILGPILAQLPMAVPVAIAASLIIRINFLNFLQISHESRIARILIFLSTSAWVQMSSGFIGTVVSRKPPYVPYSDCGIFFVTGASSLFMSAALLLASSGEHLWGHFSAPYPAGGSPTATKPGSSTIGLKAAGLVLNFALLYTSQSNRPCNIPQYPYISGGRGEVKVLASANSVTGRIVVAENLRDGFRYLRCDHSILGGVWLGEDKIAAISSTQNNIVPAGGVDYNGTRLGDSIYSAFVLQDALRLFLRTDGSSTSTAGQSALVIGLGMGVMARSLTEIGITPTILEIDPIVHAFAQTFFALPRQPNLEGFTTKYLLDPLTPQTHFGDARDYMETRVRSLGTGLSSMKEIMKYDYIVHDCFSGGMVPAHLFTKEFWSTTKKLMKDDGILAVNFAGHVTSNASRAILATLEDSFSKCRVFHDVLRFKDNPDDDSFMEKDVVNLVFFCTQSPHMRLSLREPRNTDYLDSRLRQHIFKSLTRMEVPRGRITGPGASLEPDSDQRYLLTDARNPLNDWQTGVALEHWKLMRSVLSDEMWEAY